MELSTLFAMCPVAKQLAAASPRIRKWMEQKARVEDPTLLLQLQLAEEIRNLRAYTLNTSIIGAKLANPDQSDEVRRRILEGAHIAQGIAHVLKSTKP
jgi:hypothetical protein